MQKIKTCYGYKSCTWSLCFAAAFIFNTGTAIGQDNNRLTAYLAGHKYSVDLNSDTTFNMLDKLMAGKNCFTLGEGGAHQLPLYNQLKPALANQLMRQNLKCYVIERSRCNAIFMNNYLQHKYPACPPEYDDIKVLCDNLQPVFDKRAGVTVIGVDFEYCGSLQETIQFLFGNMDLNTVPHSKPLLTTLLGNSYKNVFRSKFKKFYLKEQAIFYGDSAAMRQELGGKYEQLKYILTNQNTTYPGIDRNNAMAENIEMELSHIDTGALCMLTFGIAHTLPSETYSMMHKLYKQDAFKRRSLIMNMYCENCSLNNRDLDATPLRFLQTGDVKAIFSKEADTTLTLFDLTALPAEFNYIREEGDLLLYAKDQKANDYR